MSDLHEVEVSIEQAQAVIKDGELALKLAENKDFKRLVMDGYFVQEASRLAMLSADVTLSPAQRADVLLMIQAVGFFKAYLSGVVFKGKRAAEDLEQFKQTREEILNEDND